MALLQDVCLNNTGTGELDLPALVQQVDLYTSSVTEIHGVTRR